MNGVALRDGMRLQDTRLGTYADSLKHSEEVAVDESEAVRFDPQPPPRRFPWVWLAVLLPLPLALAGALIVRDPGGNYAFMMRDGPEPVRWNPCEPIRYVVNPSGAPPRGLEDLGNALDDVAEASGLTFTPVGETDEQPMEGRPAYQPERYGERWAPLLVGWVSEDDDAMPLEPAHYGRAGPVSVRSPDGGRVYVSGQIAISAERFPRQRPRHYATLLHEIGHVVGLGHLDDPREIMHPRASARALRLGDGDREGLRRLGAEAGCVTTPSPPGA